MKLDFKKFTKVHDDDETATLAHPDGHHIKISKKALNKQLKEQLHALPMAEGGVVEKIKEYFSPESKDKKPKSEKQNDVEFNKDKLQSTQDSMRKAFHYADGGEVDEIPVEMDAANISLPQRPTLIDTPKVSTPLDLANETVNALDFGSKPVASEEPEPTNLVLQAPQAQQQMDFMNTNPVGLQNAVGEIKSGLQKEAQALAQQSNEEAKIAQQQQVQQQQMMQHYNEQYNALESERKAIAADISSNVIDPNRYLHSMSAPQKIATAIGLIIGGIGGPGNAASKFLDDQIERDVNAQKAELGKKENLMTAALHQFGNMRDATNMTRAIYADIYSAQLKQAAAKATDPLAKARALQEAGRIDAQVAPLLQQTAQRQAITQGMKSGIVPPAIAVQHIVPKEQQTKALEELEKATEAENAMANIEKSMRSAAQLQTLASRARNPIQSKAKLDALNLQIKTIGKPIFGTLSDQETKMLQSAEIGFLDNPDTINKKIEIVKNLVNSKSATPILNSYGIKIPKTSARTTPNPNVTSNYARPRK